MTSIGEKVSRHECFLFRKNDVKLLPITAQGEASFHTSGRSSKRKSLIDTPSWVLRVGTKHRAPLKQTGGGPGQGGHYVNEDDEVVEKL